MLPKNNNRAWSAVACALLVLGLGLLAFATVGGAVNETPAVRDTKERTVPADYGIIARCDSVMLASGEPREWRWDGPETPWHP